MVEIAEQVWQAWSEVAEQTYKPVIWLRLATRVRRDRALAAVREACDDAIAALDDARPSDAREWFPGGLGAAAVPGGVAVEVLYPDDFPRLMTLLVAGLEERKISGRLELLEATSVQTPPREIPLIECRMRVLGKRYHTTGRYYKRHVDESALWQLVQEGVGWCQELGAPLGRSLGISLLPRVAVGPGDDLDGLLRSASESVGIHTFDLMAAGIERFRMVAIRPSTGCVSLIHGENDLSDNGWRSVVHELKESLLASSRLLVYALVKHGSSVSAARIGNSLFRDWPQRPGFNANAGFEAAFEDEYAPDAFAIQLLGPGYKGRIPTGASWRQTSRSTDRVVLQHADLARWFDAPFGPFGGASAAGGRVEPPDVLRDARHDFAPILFTDALGIPKPAPG